MIPYKAQAHIHSLDGEMDEITVLEKVGNKYSDSYRILLCTDASDP